MEQNDRDGRDAAGTGPYAREREQLVALSTLASWTVSEGEPDIRGWEVRTVSGRQLGSVADLLVDAKAGEVVLLDVDLPASGRHTFVPIRVVQIDRAKRVVLMDSADLPTNDIARGAATNSTNANAAGTVRYPRSDREVMVSRPTLADDMFLPDAPAHADGSAQATPNERRLADRRRIERQNTDL